MKVTSDLNSGFRTLRVILGSKTLKGVRGVGKMETSLVNIGVTNHSIIDFKVPHIVRSIGDRFD